jgi:hypothetical protein
LPIVPATWDDIDNFRKGLIMNISGIGSSTASPMQKTAADGDSPAVEAAESQATKVAEQQHGGSAPKTTDTMTKDYNASIGKGTGVDTTA